MGQVVPFTASPPPEATQQLEPAGSVLLLAIRWWVADYREGVDPMPRLCEAMRIAGPYDAAFSVDQLMAVIARTVRRPIVIHCPCCPHLSHDETCLLHVAALVQAGESSSAERMLRAVLLFASGAEFALGPLEGLGRLFSQAGLLFHPHQMAAEHSMDDAVWTPDHNRSVH